MRRHTKPEDLLNWTSSNMATDRHGRMIKIQKKGTSFTLVINSLPVFTGAPSVETAKRVAQLNVGRLSSKLATEEAKSRRSELAMTCQCCFQKILANTGVIAHHGYKRPGDGWQTSSCFGARALPFENDREKLGELIRSLEADLKTRRLNRRRAAAEGVPIHWGFTDYTKPTNHLGFRPRLYIDFTRSSFEEIKKANSKNAEVARLTSFDDLKARDLRERDFYIKQVQGDLSRCQKYWDLWKRSHEWNSKKWIKS